MADSELTRALAGAAQTIDDVKQALMRDIDAGKVYEDGSDVVFLDLNPDGSADVSPAAWALYRDDLAEPGASADENGLSYWRLTDAGRAVLEGAPT